MQLKSFNFEVLKKRIAGDKTYDVLVHSVVAFVISPVVFLIFWPYEDWIDFLSLCAIMLVLKITSDCLFDIFTPLKKVIGRWVKCLLIIECGFLFANSLGLLKNRSVEFDEAVFKTIFYMVGIAAIAFVFFLFAMFMQFVTRPRKKRDNTTQGIE